jgi:hypothetical protein
MADDVTHDWEDLNYSRERGEHTALDRADFEDRMDDIDTFFLLVGFPKTATSTIAGVLANQDAVQMPRKKEPFYFPSDEYEFGPGFYWEKYFEGLWDDEPVVGEACTANSYTPFAARRIAETIPNAKVIFSLRNPVDRAFSNWWMYYRGGLENLSFDEAVKWELTEQRNDLMPLEAEDDDYWQWYRRRELADDNTYVRRRTPRTYLMRGYYALHIERFKQYFDDEDILYVFQDRLFENRREELERIASFLDLPHELQPYDRDGHVAPKHPLHGWVSNRVLPRQDRIPEPLLDAGRLALDTVTDLTPGRVEMNDGTKETLFNYYRKKNAELEEIVDRDLSHWNESARY